MIYGKHAVLAALEAEQPLHKLWVSSGRHTDPVVTQILELAAKQGVVVQRAEREQLDRLAGPSARHNGVLATMAAARYAEVDEILAAAGEPFVLLLDGVSDPHNLGALIRTAEAAGVDGVVVTERRSAGLTGAAAKASAGAAARVPVARVVNLSRTIDELKQRGVWIVGLDADDGEDFTEANLGGPLAIVVGGEGEGLHRLVRERCDFVVRIPMQGKIASLNASVAGALVMYEARRQRALAAAEDLEEPGELIEAAEEVEDLLDKEEDEDAESE